MQQFLGTRGNQLEALDVETAFVGERRVEAAAADIHHGQNLSHRAGLTAFAPEQQQRVVHGLGSIKFSGTCHARILDRSVHTDNPSYQPRISRNTVQGEDKVTAPIARRIPDVFPAGNYSPNEIPSFFATASMASSNSDRAVAAMILNRA